MVDGIAGGGRGRIDAARMTAAQRIATLAKTNAARAVASSATEATAATRLTQDGAPVDASKVAAIRAAIAAGNYPVDPEAIAQKMIELDLGPIG